MYDYDFAMGSRADTTHMVGNAKRTQKPEQ